MKELSIEEKAKRYDEAIEIAKEINNEKCAQPFNVMTRVFHELKESENEIIRKELIDFVKSRLAGFPDCKRFTDWLEKQDEQKSIDPDTLIQQRVDALADIVEEQKSADKVEPKFKVGDWVVHDMSDGRKVIRQIINMTNKSYILDGEDFNVFSFNDLENDYHLWTIQDAKDGDVLVTKKDNPFIYDKNRYNNGLAYYYAGLDVNKELTLKSLQHMLAHFGELRSVSPATKEQRDLLFQKMKEAGYEWSEEFKEIRKIPTPADVGFTELGETWKKEANAITERQKPAWSEEDKRMSRFIGNAITADEASVYLESKDIQVIDAHVWLNELKERVQPQQKWSEEDEKMLDIILNDINYAQKNFSDSKLIPYERKVDWLKSLKERYTWKPSDEQMKALEEATNKQWDVDGDALWHLYEQLKKLREE